MERTEEYEWAFWWLYGCSKLAGSKKPLGGSLVDPRSILVAPRRVCVVTSNVLMLQEESWSLQEAVWWFLRGVLLGRKAFWWLQEVSQ